MIVVNAHRINQGDYPECNSKDTDFFFLDCSGEQEMLETIKDLCVRRLPSHYEGIDPMRDIQVLTPMRKGALGVERLNQILQQYLNPPDQTKKEKECGDRIFREGDKVMQIKNNYQLEWEISTRYGMTIDKGLGIFNGDMGIIESINTYEETVTVEYDEHRKVKYPYALLDELELAYAITIHKAQGSEYPAVVIPLLQGPRQLYHRNLLYTAITRARQCVTLVGSDTVFAEMIQNTNEQERNTSLSERIRETV
jgi:exodeoxyribonuclease V alpha subunit